MKNFILILILITGCDCFAQLDFNWSDVTIGNATIQHPARPYKMVNALNSTYVVGTVKNGGEPIQGEDIMVKRYDDAGGFFSITYHYPNSWYDEARDIAVDADGSIYVLGVSQAFEFSNGFNMVVLKFAHWGALLWSNNIPLQHMEASSIALDGSGGCYVLGRNYNPGTSTTEGYLAKLNSSGTIVWQKSLNPVTPVSNSIRTKNLVIEGNALYSLYDYQPGSSYTTKLTKHDLNGNFQWDIDLDSNFVGVKMVADDAQNVYIAGYRYGVYQTAKDIKVSTAGILQYTREYRGISAQYNDIEIDGYNNIYLVGGTFDGKVITLKFGSSLIPLWATEYSRGGGQYTDANLCMTLTPNAVMIACRFSSTGPYTSRQYTLMINNATGVLNYDELSVTQSFNSLPVDCAADNRGNFYSLIWQDAGNDDAWLVCGFHYPLYIVAHPVTTTGLYEFTTPGPRPSVDAGANKIASINVTGITGSGNLTVNFNSVEPLSTTFTGTVPANVSEYSWFISKDDAITSINAEVRFDYTQIENAGITNPADVKIYKRDVSGTGDFTELSTTVVGNELRATVTSFGEFILASATQPLPVELASFTSEINQNSVKLRWSTVNENNNRGFAVERKNAEGQYTEIGFVNGNGTSNTAHSYSFNDNNLLTGKYEYRLMQMDYNGNYKYYNLNSEVNIGLPSKFSLSQNYPNPFNPSTKINYELPMDGLVSLKIYDMSGKEVYYLVNEVKAAGYYTVSFDASKLSSGIYLYRITAGEFTSVKKMTFIK
jgi:hypothetical protein